MTIRSGGRPRDTARRRGPSVRPRRLRDRKHPGVLAAGPAAAGAAVADGGGGVDRAAQVPGLRARPGGARPGDRPDRAPAGGRRRGHGHRRRQPGGPPAAVRQGHRRREPRPGPDDPASRRTRPRSSSSSSRATRPSRSPTARGGRVSSRDSRAFVFIAIEQNLTGVAPAGDVHPAQEHDPRPARQGAARAGARSQVRRHRPADRPPARADHGQARDAPAPDGRVGLLRPRRPRRRPS